MVGLPALSSLQSICLLIAPKPQARHRPLSMSRPTTTGLCCGPGSKTVPPRLRPGLPANGDGHTRSTVHRAPPCRGTPDPLITRPQPDPARQRRLRCCRQRPPRTRDNRRADNEYVDRVGAQGTGGGAAVSRHQAPFSSRLAIDSQLIMIRDIASAAGKTGSPCRSGMIWRLGSRMIMTFFRAVVA
jgi:hypothetical protein